MGDPGPLNSTDQRYQRLKNPYGYRDYTPPTARPAGGGVPPRGYGVPYFCPYGPSSGKRAVVVMTFGGAYGSVADGDLFVMHYGANQAQALTVEADVSSNGAGAAIFFTGAPTSTTDLLTKIANAINGAPGAALGGMRVGVGTYGGQPALYIVDTDYDFDAYAIHLTSSTGELIATNWTITQVDQGYDVATAEPGILGQFPIFLPGPESITC